MTISFWLAGSKLNRAGLAPIFAKISVKGKKHVQLSTGITIPPARWQPSGFGYVTGADILPASYNERLLTIRDELQAIYNDLDRLGKPISAKLIKDIFTGAQLTQVRLQAAMLTLVNHKKQEGKTKDYIRSLLVRCRAIASFLTEIGEQYMLVAEISLSFMNCAEDYFRI